MKKVFTVFFIFLFSCLVFAATFNAEPGEMRATVDKRTGTVSLTWTGIGNIVFIEQYLTREVDGKWILRHKADGNSATFNGFIGDRFNVIDKSGRYLMLTPEMAVSKLRPVKFHGLSLECSNSNGCALQVDPEVP